ncbi:MAG TPA: LptF/LptG family permease [Pelagibacteraceae bacterium]|nr:LptF/LptG family permease [Pelagibacteraceae bacterium]
MRNTIYRYFFKEFISIFALILISITVIVWIVQAVNYLDFVTEDGHAFGVYFTYSILNIPKVINRLIPLVFLISLLVTILRFENSNELLIFWTSGLNKIRIVNFIIIISILITLFQLSLSLVVTHSSLNFARSILKSSSVSLFPSLVKEKKFNDTVKNLTVFVEKKKNNGEMLNIFLRDDSSIVERSKTIIAKNGYIIKRNEKNILVLYNGTIQTEKKNNKINFINFNRTEINLSSFSTKTTTYPKIQENDTLSLLNCIKPFLDESKTIIKKFQCRARIDDIISELNRRLMMPFYIPFISIIICYLLSSGKESKYYLLKKYIVFIVAFSVLVFAEIMVRYSGQSILYSAAYYLLPPSLILLNYLYLTKIFKYENLGK